MGVEDGSDRRSTTAPHHTKERPSSKKGNILWYFFCAVVVELIPQYNGWRYALRLKTRIKT